MRSFTSLFAALLIATIFVLSGGNASAHVVTCDFTTGGGWILIPSGTASGSLGLPESGEKANFGIVGGCKNGGFYGHANYVDHNNGLHVNGPVTGDLDPCIGGCGFPTWLPGPFRARDTKPRIYLLFPIKTKGK